MTPAKVKVLWKTKRNAAIRFLLDNPGAVLFEALAESEPTAASKWPPDNSVTSVNFERVTFELRQQHNRKWPRLNNLPLFRTFDVFHDGVLIDRLTGI